LSALLVAGTLPGVIAGATIRVELLAGGRAFMFIAAGVLAPLGLWLLLGAQRLPRERPEPTRRARGAISVLALVVGTVGGIYGIGGGSLILPVLLAAGFSAYEVAPATLLATFLTSIVGIATYQVLQLTHGGGVAPEWIPPEPHIGGKVVQKALDGCGSRSRPSHAELRRGLEHRARATRDHQD